MSVHYSYNGDIQYIVVKILGQHRVKFIFDYRRPFGLSPETPVRPGTKPHLTVLKMGFPIFRRHMPLEKHCEFLVEQFEDGYELKMEKFNFKPQFRTLALKNEFDWSMKIIKETPPRVRTRRFEKSDVWSLIGCLDNALDLERGVALSTIFERE